MKQSSKVNRLLAESSILVSGKEGIWEKPVRHCEPAKQVWQSGSLRNQPVGVPGKVPDITEDFEQITDATREQKT